MTLENLTIAFVLWCFFSVVIEFMYDKERGWLKIIIFISVMLGLWVNSR